jgi:hypothetical protein
MVPRRATSSGFQPSSASGSEAAGNRALVAFAYGGEPSPQGEKPNR